MQSKLEQNIGQSVASSGYSIETLSFEIPFSFSTAAKTPFLPDPLVEYLDHGAIKPFLRVAFEFLAISTLMLPSQAQKYIAFPETSVAVMDNAGGTRSSNLTTEGSLEMC